MKLQFKVCLWKFCCRDWILWESIAFLSTTTALRSYHYFDNLVYTNNHQLKESPFLFSGIKFVESFPSDYVNLLCLGVMKRPFFFLKWIPRLRNLSNRPIGQTSEKLEKLKGLFPSEMAWQWRGLNDVKRFKATKLRTFLLCTGVVILKGILSQAYYKHFVALYSNL